MRNITVITKGKTQRSIRGFLSGDAGKGAYVHGAYATASQRSKHVVRLQRLLSADAITMTNGVRVQWLNSFHILLINPHIWF